MMKIANFYFFILVLSNLIFLFNSQVHTNIRTVKLSDFVENGSYLPIRKGEEFIIEVEGNPKTGYKWYLENAELVARNKILFPKNLDQNGSGNFYNSHKEHNMLNGLYHFLFSTVREGNEKLIFSYYKDPKQKIKKTIEVHVKDLKKKDL